jgi:hypothetical protein
MGGSKKKQTVAYKYFLGMHMVLCHGPIDYIKNIKVDDKLLTDGQFSDEQISVDEPELFGGEKREGGIVGSIDIATGASTQTPNDYLQSQLGDNIPAFRGVVSVILRKVYLGLNPYLKKWSFRAQRVHLTSGGETQWYDAKAPIYVIRNQPIALYFALDFSSSMDITTSNGNTRFENMEIAVSGALDTIKQFVSYGGSQGVDIMIVGFGVAPNTYESILRRNCDADDIDDIKDWIHTSTPDMPATYFPAGVSSAPSFFSGAPSDAYRASLFITDGEPANTGFTAGEIAQDAQDILFSVDDLDAYGINIDLTDTTYTEYLDNTPDDGVPVVSGSDPDALQNIIMSAISSQIDLNPAHIIREAITDGVWGMGYLAADVDDDWFEAAADTLYDEGMGMSILWSGSKSIEEFIQSVTNHIGASLYVARDTGKFTLKLIRDDYDIETIPSFDESNVTKIENLNRQDVSELVSSVTVKYWDHNTGKTASLTVSDPSLEIMRGYSVGTIIDYPGFTNPDVAGRAALRDLRSLSTPLWSCNVHADKTARSLSIGDVFKLSWDDYGLADIVMRVTGMSFGDGKNNSVKITCVQDIFSLPSSTISSAPDTEDGWSPIDNTPVAVPVRKVEEAPYREIVTMLGDSDAAVRLAENEDIGFLLVSGSRPATGAALNASIYVDSGAGYSDSGVMDFSPIAYLNENVTKSQTTVSVDGMVDIDLIDTGTYARIGDELVRIDAVSSSSLTIARGLLDTVPADHSEDDAILFNDQYVASDETEYIASDELDVKLLTATSAGLLPEADAPIDSVTMDSRAIRPYPPGNFKINGEYWPETVMLGDIIFTWAHRDRTQQTSGEYFDFTDTNIGPETGTTYTILIKDASETTLHTESGITGTTWTYTEAALNSDTSNDIPSGLIVEIWSVRDGYASWQSHIHAFDLVIAFNLTETPTESYNLTNGVL